MQRFFTGLLAIIAVLLALTPARADQTYTQQVLFQASDQSMWPADNPRAYYPIDLTTAWDWTFDEQARRYITAVGTFSAGVNGATSGRVGLVVTPYANGGAVSVYYPLTLTLTYPDPATLSPGQTFAVKTSWAPIKNGLTVPILDVKSPKVGITVDGIFNASAYLRVTGRAFGDWVFRNTIIDTTFDVSHNLFDTASLGSGQKSLYGGALTVQTKSANLRVLGSTSGDGTVIQTNASSDFLKFVGSISNLLVKYFWPAGTLKGAPTLSGAIDYSYRGTGFTGSYAFLQLTAELPVTASQQLQFTPRPTLKLHLSNSNQDIPMDVGESVQLTMPADGSPLTITPTLSFPNELTNTMSVGIGGSGAGLFFAPLDVHCRMSLAGYTLPTLDYHLPKDALMTLDSTLSATIYHDSTGVTFAPQTLPAFVLTPTVPPPPPDPPVAGNFFYTTQFDSVHNVWYVNVPAPGVLSGQTNPNIRAIPQSEGTLNDYTTGWFILSADGSLFFAVPGTPSSNYSVTKNYTIIDPDTGLTASNIITFRIGTGG